VCPKVVVCFTHEVHFDPRCKLLFELLLNQWVHQKVDKVIYVYGKVQWWVARNDVSNEEAIFMCGLLETNGMELFGNKVIPVLR
jgi:hypothetical protein